MKTGYLFAPLFACLFSCGVDHSSCEFAGTYKTSGFNHGTKLSLRIDHSFNVTAYHYDCFGGEEQYIVDGVFSVSGDKIFLSPSHFHVVRYEDDSLPGRQDKKLEEDSTHDLSAIHHTMREYQDTLQVVKWNERLFILGANRGQIARDSYNGYSNSIIELLNLINRNPKVVRNYYGYQHIVNGFWNKLCDDCKEEDIEKVLPTEWADFVLKAPIKGQIIDVKQIADDNYGYSCTLNVGYSDNVRQGMSFLTEKSVGQHYEVIITDVFEKTSKGFIFSLGFKPETNVPLTTFDENADWN